MNSANPPGLIALVVLAAVQSISDTASVICPSSVWIGVASFAVWVVNVQPGWLSTRTDAIGVSVGNFTLSPVVLADSLSVGTRKMIVASLPPRVAPGAVTVTCAAAGP